jgi:hypothetical protein
MNELWMIGAGFLFLVLLSVGGYFLVKSLIKKFSPEKEAPVEVKKNYASTTGDDLTASVAGIAAMDDSPLSEQERSVLDRALKRNETIASADQAKTMANQARAEENRKKFLAANRQNLATEKEIEKARAKLADEQIAAEEATIRLERARSKRALENQIGDLNLQIATLKIQKLAKRKRKFFVFG